MNKFTKLVLWQIVLIAATFFTKYMTEIYGINVPTSLGIFAAVHSVAIIVAVVSASIGGFAVVAVTIVVTLIPLAILPLTLIVFGISIAIASATIIIVKASNLQFFWVQIAFLFQAASIFSIMYFDGAVRNSFVITGITLLVLLHIHGKSHDLCTPPYA